MKSYLLAVLLALTPLTLSAEDSIKVSFHDSQQAANEQTRYMENTSLIPTLSFPSYDPWTGTYKRITWMTVVPHVPNNYDVVPTMPLPNSSVQNCSYVCNGTLRVCSMRFLSGAFDTSYYSTQAQRDFAYDNLEQFVKNYTVKLTVPIGNETKYILLIPTIGVVLPSVICE